MANQVQISSFGSPMHPYGPEGGSESEVQLGSITGSGSMMFIPVKTAIGSNTVTSIASAGSVHTGLRTDGMENHAILDIVKNDIMFSIYSVEAFLTSLNPLANAVDIERGNYVETPDVNGSFDGILRSFQSNAHYFSLQLGEGLTIPPDYIDSLRQTMSIMNSNYVSPQLQILMMSLDTTQGAASVAVPKRLITSLVPNLLSGLFTKISANFKYSEFSLAFNWKLLELAIASNAGAAGPTSLSSIVTYINSNIDFLRNASDFYSQFCDNMSNRIQAKLTGANRFTSTGEINTSEWILHGLSSTAIEKVMKVKRLTNFVMNNAINEIKINAGVDTIRYASIIFPTTVTAIE